MREALVVGAGLAGLVAARELVLHGWSVRVLEAAPIAGGQLKSHEVAGIQLDEGAATFDPRGTAMRTYLAALGLSEQVVRQQETGTWLHSAEEVTGPLPVGSLLGIPPAPLAKDVVRIVGQRAAWRGMLDAALPGPVGARAATVGELVRRRMGDGILDNLVAPVVEARHSCHPDDLPIEAVPGLVHHLLRENSLARAVARLSLDEGVGGETASLNGGMATLIGALLRELDRFGVPVDYECRVVEVHDDHIVLATEDPDVDGAELHGTVVVAAPGLVGAGSRTATHFVTLVVDSPALADAPRGGGVVVARASRVRARSLAHVSAQWAWVREAAEGREVLRLSYENAPTAEQARLEASQLLGFELPASCVEGVAVTSWHRAERVAAATGIALVGEQVAGPGIATVLDHSQRVMQQLET
jgi:oxygen-dependent protoporphyrinogen oxidase